MKRIGLFIFVSTAVVLVPIGIACKKSSSSGSSTGTQDSVLLNIGNNIIKPNYIAINGTFTTMDTTLANFLTNTNSTELVNLQARFKALYVAWQSISEYNYFGPASTAQPSLTTMNVFPADTATIKTNISNNNDNINTVANVPAKGLSALDYLLFGRDNGTLLTLYTTDANAANRKRYLQTVFTDVVTEIGAVVGGWVGAGNYLNTFVNGSGNSISSSLGLLLNSLDQDFENLKNYRLGVPLGKIPVGSSSPVAPYEVEAYYSGISVQLALAQLKAVQGIYLGVNPDNALLSISATGNGLGLQTYLQRAEQQKNLKYNGGLLSDTIRLAFAQAVTDLQALPDPLSATIQTDPTNANKVFAECQRLVALLKTDLPSDLGVLINYGDNDGD